VIAEAALAPKCTAEALARSDPVIVTELPPSEGPEAGERLATVGSKVKTYMSAGPTRLVPPGVVTVTSTVPVPAGAVAVTEVAVLAVIAEAALAPKCTAEALARSDPVIVTELPPSEGPEAGDKWDTTGRATYVYRSAGPLVVVPPGVVTLMSTAPVPAGAVAVTDVSEFAVKLAGLAPKLTPVAPARFDPVIPTSVPPAFGPALGLIDRTIGVGSAAKITPMAVQGFGGGVSAQSGE
jgi:hypothetical protein